MPKQPKVAASRAVAHLMDLLRIEGPSGREAAVARCIKQKLRAAGCKPSWMVHDKAHQKIPGDFEIGNLIVKIPGTYKAPRRLFMGHMDTVPLCKGAVPVRKGSRIVSRGQTALGGDNRTACACLVSLVELVLKHHLEHPPLTILFTVGEEIGLWGAKTVQARSLGSPKMGFNIDSGNPAEIIVGAIGADRWRVEIHGRSSHAGMHPEDGISAAVVASVAIQDVVAKGYFGKIKKGKKQGTSNIGSIRGGEASNQVMDHLVVTGESRSHQASFVAEISQAYRKSFERAAQRVKNNKGKTGKIIFKAHSDYPAFRMPSDSSILNFVRRSAKGLGIQPRFTSVNGGLDANYLNLKGIPTVTLGAGQHSAHTIDEYVDVEEYVQGVQLALTLATAF